METAVINSYILYCDRNPNKKTRYSHLKFGIELAKDLLSSVGDVSVCTQLYTDNYNIHVGLTLENALVLRGAPIVLKAWVSQDTHCCYYCLELTELVDGVLFPPPLPHP